MVHFSPESHFRAQASDVGVGKQLWEEVTLGFHGIPTDIPQNDPPRCNPSLTPTLGQEHAKLLPLSLNPCPSILLQDGGIGACEASS